MICENRSEGNQNPNGGLHRVTSYNITLTKLHMEMTKAIEYCDLRREHEASQIYTFLDIAFECVYA